jgi:hypothetical protein
MKLKRLRAQMVPFAEPALSLGASKIASQFFKGTDAQAPESN